jgi:hypothetical protein
MVAFGWALLTMAAKTATKIVISKFLLISCLEKNTIESLNPEIRLERRLITRPRPSVTHIEKEFQ